MPKFTCTYWLLIGGIHVFYYSYRINHSVYRWDSCYLHELIKVNNITPHNIAGKSIMLFHINSLFSPQCCKLEHPRIDVMDVRQIILANCQCCCRKFIIDLCSPTNYFPSFQSVEFIEISEPFRLSDLEFI